MLTNSEVYMITLTFEDTQNIRNYSKHFKVKIPQGLENAMIAFDNEANENTFTSFKIEICLWLTTSRHFKNDSMWAAPIEAAKKVLEVMNASK
jgi:hypothetical protein